MQDVLILRDGLERSLDWPLSREEKKERVMRLYEGEVRAVEYLLETREAALEALEADVAFERRQSDVKSCSQATRRSPRMEMHASHEKLRHSETVIDKGDGTHRGKPTNQGLVEPDAECKVAATVAGACSKSARLSSGNTSGSCTRLQVPMPCPALRQDLRELITYGSSSVQLSSRASTGSTSADSRRSSSSGEEPDELNVSQRRRRTSAPPSSKGKECAEYTEAVEVADAEESARWWPAGASRAPGRSAGIGRQGPRSTASGLVGGTRKNEGFPEVSWKPSLHRFTSSSEATSS